MPRHAWGHPDAYRSRYERGPTAGPPRRGRPGPFIGPALVLAFVMAATIAPTSPEDMSVFPLLIFPVIATLMILRAHRVGRYRHRGPGYRDVPAPWNRPSAEEPAPGRPAAGPAPTTTASWPTPAPDVRSPFDRPAFWDEAPGTANLLPAAKSGVLSPMSPPAWDPLGVAPFAWDLPEPPPRELPRQRWTRAVVARMSAGAAVLVCASAVVGDVAGWWPLSTVVAASWAVIALVIGLLIGSHRKQSVR